MQIVFPDKSSSTYADSFRYPSFFRRAMAELLDRLIPLPWLVWWRPSWLIVVVCYHLFCAANPARRSPGQFLFRMRVVSQRIPTKHCSWWRAVLRRSGTALTQALWCSWHWMSFALALECLWLACVWCSRLRPEDFLCRTRVVTEHAYRNWSNQIAPRYF